MGVRKKFVCFSETVRYRKLMLRMDIGKGCRCATSWCDLDLTFDLAVLILSYKILSELYLRNCSETLRCRKLLLSRDLVGSCRCATSWCDLDLTFDITIVTLTYNILYGLYLSKCKVFPCCHRRRIMVSLEYLPSLIIRRFQTIFGSYIP